MIVSALIRMLLRDKKIFVFLTTILIYCMNHAGIKTNPEYLTAGTVFIDLKSGHQ